MLDNLIESVEYRGCLIDIAYDMDPIHPSNDDNLGDIASCLERYDMGPQLCRYAGNAFAAFQHYLASKYFAMEDYSLLSKRQLNQFLFTEIRGYIHSGISLSVNQFANGQHYDRFDSGVAGFIYAKKEDIREYFGVKNITAQVQERTINCFQREVECLSAYLNGDVYVVQADCYGSTDYSGCYVTQHGVEYAKQEIDEFLVQRAKARQSKLKCLIKNKCSIEHRSRILNTLAYQEVLSA